MAQSITREVQTDGEEAKYVRQADRIVKRMLASPDINSANKALLRKFLIYLRARNSAPRTMVKHVYLYEKLMKSLGRKIVLLKANRRQMEALVAKINSWPVGDLTKANAKITLKMLFKHYIGKDEYTPPIVGKWISVSAEPKRRLTRGDLFTREDVEKMIANAGSLRNSAIIALLADVPLRPHELIRCRRKHLNLEAENPYLIVPENTKTGSRKVVLCDSIPRLAAYCNSEKDLKPDDPLFLDYTWHRQRKGLTYSGLNMMVKRVGERAGVSNVYLYKFRHGAITFLAESPEVSPAQIEAQAGWKHGGYARNTKTYTHLNEKKTESAILAAKGRVPAEKAEVRPRIVQCWRCKASNSTDMAYCGTCGAGLGVASAVAQSRNMDILNDETAASVEDPKYIEEQVHRYLMKKRAGRRR